MVTKDELAEILAALPRQTQLRVEVDQQCWGPCLWRVSLRAAEPTWQCPGGKTTVKALAGDLLRSQAGRIAAEVALGLKQWRKEED